MLYSSSAWDMVALFRFSYLCKQLCKNLIISFLQVLNQVNFFNSGLSNVIRWEDILLQNLSLNLNSDVIFYTTTENGFNLTESYTIKAGSPISHSVGTWDRDDGLVIPETSIWERRSNLFGVSIDAAVMSGNSFLMKVSNLKGIQEWAFCNFYSNGGKCNYYSVSCSIQCSCQGFTYRLQNVCMYLTG